METLLYLLNMAAGKAPPIPLDDALRPTWLFGQTVHDGCDRAGYYEQAEFAEEYGAIQCIVKLGCWGPGRAMQRGQARLDGGNWRVPKHWRNLYWLHHARIPRQIHAFHESTSGFAAVLECGRDVWPCHPCVAAFHSGLSEQGAELEASKYPEGIGFPETTEI